MEEVSIESVAGTRWFRNSEIDLLVEQKANGEISNFTFSYRRSGICTSLEWDGWQLRTFHTVEAEGEPNKPAHEAKTESGQSGVEEALIATPIEAYKLLAKVGSALDPNIFNFVSTRIASKV